MNMRCPPAAHLGTAPACLNIGDKAMWITGWNDCRKAILATESETKADPKPQPLTELQLIDALTEANWPPSMLAPVILAKLLEYGRQVEYAHKIGVKP